MRKNSLMLPGFYVLALGWSGLSVAESQLESADVQNRSVDNILFISNHDGDHEIYLIKKLGEKPIQLTSNHRDDVGISWSPNGKKILFSSMRDGNSEIYMMDADGGNQTNLTQHSGLDFSPSWSPDGQRVLFVSNRDGKEDIFLLSLNDNYITKITESTSGAFLPQWSPNGKMIAYKQRNEGSKAVHLVVTDASGKNKTRLTQHKKDIDMQFNWSPDSRSIVVASKRKKLINIFNINIENGETKQLTHTSSSDIMPQYSPDGKKILFLSQREHGTRQELFIMNADGSEVRKLIPSQNMEYMNPSWSPDGRWITFSRYENRHFAAYAYSIHQKKMVKLSQDKGFQFHPTYAPHSVQMTINHRVPSQINSKKI